MSAIDAALATIDGVGAEGEMDAAAPAPVSFDLDGVADPILLPDGKRIYPPMLFGEPIDELARRLIDTKDPAASRFLRLIGPPGTGKSIVARALAYRLWLERGMKVQERHGKVFGVRVLDERRAVVHQQPPVVGAHNSAIIGGHGHAVDGITATVAQASSARGRRDDRSPGMRSSRGWRRSASVHC